MQPSDAPQHLKDPAGLLGTKLGKGLLEELAQELSSQLKRERAARNDIEQRLSRQDDFIALTRETDTVLLSEMDLVTGAVYFEGDAQAMFGLTEVPSLYDQEAWRALIPQPDFTTMSKAFVECMDKGVSYAATYRIRHADGSMRWISTRGRFIYDECGVPKRAVYIHVDITDQKAFEHKLHHAHKLAAIGELAASFGHEVNTPLTIIQGCIYQLRRALDRAQVDPNEFRRKFDMIDMTTTRIAELVARLKGISRFDGIDVTVFNVVDVVAETVRFFASAYEQIGIDVSMAAELPCLFASGNRGRFNQMIMNLLSNARDAVASSERKEILVSMMGQDKDLIIQVRDTGLGIAAADLKKLFQPFYTTKPIGKGLGLGLSLCENIVTEMSGRLSVQSVVGEGTTFTVRLPQVRQSPA